MIRSLAFVFFACLLLVARVTPAAERAQQWLVVSDVHFDPFADPRIVERLAAAPVNRWREIFAAAKPQPLAAYGSDTNDALLESSLDAMRNAVQTPAAVIVAGDFLAHGFRERFERTVKNHDEASYDAFVDKTIAFLAAEFQMAFPHARLLPAIGNNDGYCGDYESTPRSPFLAHMAAAWGASVGSSDPSAFVAQFSSGGYYALALPVDRARAIVLNDVFWSTKYTNACGDKNEDPGGDELTWLRNTLTAAGNAPVWIIAHVPPGVDVYASLHDPSQASVMFLADRFNQSFLAALDSTTPSIVMTIAGHTHMDGFAVVGTSAPVTPVLEVPSISPIFGNNPAFAVLDVDPHTALVQDEQVFVLDDLAALARDAKREARWHREYDFDSIYGRGMLDAAHLAGAQRLLFEDEKVRRRFVEFHDGSSARDANADQDVSWRAYWCGGIAFTAIAYSACAAPQIQRELPPHPPVPATPVP